MDKSTKRWLTVALGVLLAGAVLGVAAVGSMIYFVTSNIHSEEVSEARVIERFERERQRFSGRQPLVQIVDRDAVEVHRPAAIDAAGPGLVAVRILVYDPRSERITNVRIPFAAIRWMPSGRFSIGSAGRIDWERSNLTVDDLERFGPGLILDHEDASGTRALIWTE
jgi:hypothetical protein